MSSLERRLERLEDAARPEPEAEQEREKWRERIREAAEQSIERSRREGKEPVFEITDSGDVFCTHDGRPVTEWRQTLAEEWYRQELEWGSPDLIHDEEREAFFTLEGDLALSRYVVNLRHLFNR
jgi:hypothetical protein